MPLKALFLVCVEMIVEFMKAATVPIHDLLLLQFNIQNFLDDSFLCNFSHIMRKPTFCICENKGQ